MRRRRVLVTGGTRGIGRAAAAALTARGHDVVIVARRGDLIAEAVADGVATSGETIDVRDTPALADFAQAGGFEILVNNAGGASTAPFMKTDVAAFRAMFALNVESMIGATRACLPAMIAAGFGRVITIASTAGLKGYGYVSAYAAAKHAVIGVTRSLALEVAAKGVTVNAVCPGYTETDLVAQSVAGIAAKTGRSEDEARKHFTASNPMGRLVRPEEVADAICWLSGESAASINGQAIVIAGGEL